MRLGVDWDGLVSVDPIGTEYGFLSFLVDSYGKRITVSSESWFQAHSIALWHSSYWRLLFEHLEVIINQQVAGCSPGSPAPHTCHGCSILESRCESYREEDGARQSCRSSSRWTRTPVTVSLLCQVGHFSFADRSLGLNLFVDCFFGSWPSQKRIGPLSKWLGYIGYLLPRTVVCMRPWQWRIWALQQLHIHSCWKKKCWGGSSGERKLDGKKPRNYLKPRFLNHGLCFLRLWGCSSPLKNSHGW